MTGYWADLQTASSIVAAASSAVSVMATIFIVRLTMRYARSADTQAAAATLQAEIASRSAKVLELQIRETQEGRIAIALAAAVAVGVMTRIWVRLLQRNQTPSKPSVIPAALLRASIVTIQFSVTDAHRMRRIYDMLTETQADLDRLRNSPIEPLEATAVSEQIHTKLTRAHEEAMRVVRSLAGEHAAEICDDLKLPN